MLTQENDVETHALAARGWNQSAISRHTGRDRKTCSRARSRTPPPDRRLTDGVSGRTILEDPIDRHLLGRQQALSYRHRHHLSGALGGGADQGTLDVDPVMHDGDLRTLTISRA